MPANFEIDGHSVPVPKQSSLFECAESVGVRVPTSCHKNGKCRECLVEVTAGMHWLTPREPAESHLSDQFRLACQARFLGDEGDVRCQTMRRGALRIEDEGQSKAPPTLDPAVMQREGSVYLDGRAISSWGEGPIHGLAVDVGTTTVVLRLVDLRSGRIVAARSFENPQRFGGSDVMARIRYDTDHPGRLLQRTLIGYLTHAIEALQVDPQSIFEIVVAGNSTMRDLMFGLPVETIGQRPYRSTTEHDVRAGRRETTSLSVAARKLRLVSHPEARVWSLPLVSGHVGADAAACLLSIDMVREDRTVALLDIGTNTELFVGNRKRLLAASCPAGPAFESGVVSCGMPGLEGAIESVAIDGDRVDFHTIGGGPPEGICGSGLVGLLSELLRTGRMNSVGRFEDGSSEFVVDADHGIAISEADISELAQAKGANVAGLRIVLDRAGVASDEIDELYLAGGFAKYLDIDAARRIGFIPDIASERITRVGNASIEGATAALRSVTARTELQELVRRIEHVELETHPQFFDYFVDGCQFMKVGRDITD